MTDPEQGGNRRGAIAGLAIAVAILALGLWLAHDLTAASKMQDCLMSGRTNCNVIPAPWARFRSGRRGAAAPAGLAIRHLLEIAHLKKSQQASQFSKIFGRAWRRTARPCGDFATPKPGIACDPGCLRQLYRGLWIYAFLEDGRHERCHSK
jgi:hypothetical protein